MDFGKLVRILLCTTILGIIGASFVESVTYQVEPLAGDEVNNFTSACVSSNPGLSCLTQNGEGVLKTFGLPLDGTECSSVVIKALIGENLGFWKCIVINLGVPTLSNPDRVVIFGNETLPGSTLLKSSWIALGPSPNVEARLDNDETEITATANAPVNLYCTSDSSAPAIFLWEYRNSTNGLWRVFSHSQNVTVSGVYGELWCSSWNKYGPVRSKSTLVITDGSESPKKLMLGYGMHSSILESLLSYGPPTNVEANSATGENELTVSDADPVNLYCTSDLASPARYIWEYRNPITGLWRVFHHGRILTVRGVYGELWCTAWNGFGPVRSKSSITISRANSPDAPKLLQMPFLTSSVAMPPVLSVDASFATDGIEKIATYNDTIDMYCTSNATHLARYIWFYRNNITGALRIFSSGKNITVHGVYGEFWCSVWTRLGSTSSKTTLQILHAPEWIDVSTSLGEETTISILKNESVILSCNSDAYPAAAYRWERREKPLKPWKVYSLTQNVEVPGKKKGEYSCVATNTLGTLRSEETITISTLSPVLLSESYVDSKNEESAGVDTTATAITGGIVAAVVIMFIVLGAAVKHYKKQANHMGTYKELKRNTYSKMEDSNNAHERTALVTATSNMC